MVNVDSTYHHDLVSMIKKYANDRDFCFHNSMLNLMILSHKKKDYYALVTN